MGRTDDERRRAAELARRAQREASDRGRKSNDLGRWFHYGIAELRGETRDKGWQHEQSVTLPSGRERIHDNSRSVNAFEFREYKEGQTVGGKFVMEQISKEGEGLRTDPTSRGAWVTREGALDSAARAEVNKLVAEFGERFRVEEISQELAARAVQTGKELERNRDQMELFNSSQLRDQQRAKEYRERAEEKARTRAAAREAMEKQERERQIREERRKQREAVERVAERARLDREAVARGEKPPMSPHQAADILRINRPTPGARSAFREPPQVTRSRGDAPGRDRNRELERDR